MEIGIGEVIWIFIMGWAVVTFIIIEWPDINYKFEKKYGVRVPNLCSKTFSEAKKLACKKGFVFKVGDPVYTDSFEEGEIVLQNPLVGKRIPFGSIVSVCISKGNLEEFCKERNGG